MIAVLGMVVVVALMISVNALYVAGEFGTVSARKTRIVQAAEEGNRLAKLLLPIVSNSHKLDNYIAASQVGITLSSLVLGLYGQEQIAPFIAPLIADLPFIDSDVAAAGISTTLVLIVLTAMQVVLGELVPKSIALLYPEQTALATVVPMRWSSDVLFKPLIILLNGTGTLLLRLLGVKYDSEHKHVHSPEEIQILIQESEAGGLLDADERQLLDNAFRVGELSAREVAVPRTQMTAAPLNTPIKELLTMAADSVYTRIPIYDGDIDHITGFVHIKELYNLYYKDGETANVQSVMRKAPFVPESMSANEVWATLDREKSYLAIVFDEYGGTLGMITREDLIEELFGEVMDEFDQEKNEITPAGERRYVVRGDTLIAHVNDVLDIELSNEHADTLGGLVLHHIGRIPRVGDQVEIDGILFRVETMRRRMIAEVSATLPEKTSPED